MAQRRMISLEVVDTDAFLDMPLSAQALYFHMNNRADDDGFIANPKRIMRTLGVQEDDLKLLIAKKFVIRFEDGVCVVKHWRINNFVRKDRYRETKYLNHKQALFIRENGAYTLTDDGTAVPVPRGHFQIEDVEERLTSGQPLVNAGKDRIGKDRIGKDRIGKDSTNTTEKRFSALGADVINLFQNVNACYKNWFNNTTQRAAADRLIESYGFDQVRNAIELLPKTNQMPYVPTITTPRQLEEKWAALESALIKQKQKGGNNMKIV